MLPIGAFCNTFDLHQSIIGLDNQVSVFREWSFYTGFTVFCFKNLQQNRQQLRFGWYVLNNGLTGCMLGNFAFYFSSVAFLVLIFF